jgi:uncharacterized protein YpiB (UPF0302 family)
MYFKLEVDNEIILQNKQRVPEIYNDITSHRSEAYGILCAIKTLETIIEYIKFCKGNIKCITSLLLCDNESVVKTLNTYKYNKPTMKDFYSADHDIINNIRQIWKKLKRNNIQIAIQHIKGHQDRDGTILSDNAKLNVLADLLATKSLTMRQNVDPTILLSDYKKILRQNYLSIDL